MEPCHWSEGRHNYVGVSLQERRATMLVVSLRARWDATLVDLMGGSAKEFHQLKARLNNRTGQQDTSRLSAIVPAEGHLLEEI